MALPNDFFANGNNGSPGVDLPALTPQWMLSRSNSSTLESRTGGAPPGGGGEETTWRGSSAKDKGPVHFTSRYGDNDSLGRGSRWREEERDGRREMGRWGSAPIGADLLEPTKTLGLGATGPGGSRWDAPSFGRGRGGGFDSEIWGGSRFGGKGDRWDAGDLPGMAGATRPSGPGGRFPSSNDPRPLADSKLDSWRSSTNPGLSGAPPSLSGFVVPGSQAQGQSEAPSRSSALIAGRGRGFTMGRGRGIKPPVSQGASAFLDQQATAGSKGKDKMHTLIGTPPPGVRNYTIAQLLSIWHRLNSANRLRIPAAMRQALPAEETGLCRMPSDPKIPSPAEVVASHLAVVNETFSNPDASTQPVGLSGLGRGRGFGRLGSGSVGAFPDRESNGGFGSPVHQEQPAKAVEPWRPPSMNGGAPGAGKPAGSEPQAAAVPGSMLDLSSSLSSQGPSQGLLAPEATHGSPLKTNPATNAHSLTPEFMAILMGGDQWMYRDPQGNMQGPFTKQDLIDWFEAGFFPQDLAIRSILYPPHAPFVPLFAALPVWMSHAQLPANMPPGFGLGPDALLAQLVRMANSSSGDAGMAQRQQPNQGALQAHQFQGHPLQQHLQQHAQSMPMGSMSLGQGAGLDTAALLLQQLAGQGVMQHAPGVQQLPESLLQDLGNMDMGAVSQSGQADAGALNHILAPPASSTPVSSHDTPVQEPPRPSQSQPPVSPWARASEQPGASLSHIQKEQVFDSASQKAAQRSEVLQGSLNLPDDEDLLFPMPPAAKSQQARPQPTPSQPAIVAPRRRTPAVVAASKTPAPAPAPQPSPVQPTPQYIPEPEPLEHQPQPAAPRPETKVAPWAGAATVQQSQGKSLADIQREEQQRAAVRAAEVAHAPAVTVPITQAPMVTGWSHVAKAGMSSAMPPPQQAASVRQIQMQEEMRLRQQQQQAAAATARATPPTVPVNPAGATPSGITLADMLPQGRGAKGAPAWGSGGNMRSIYDEETPADLEGGADEEGLDEALAAFYLHQQQQQQQQQRNQPRAPAAQQAKSMKELQEEEMMRQRQAVPPATRQQAPRTDSNLLWDDEPASEAPAVEGEGLAARSPAFIDWCKEQMQALTGKTDLTLIEFLLTLASGGEVAEYTQMYLGSSAKVSAFTAEFIRRKYADIKAGGSSSKKAKKKAAQAIATSATPVSEQRGAPPILPPRAAPQQQAAPVRAAAAPAMRQAAPMAHPGIARQGSAPQAALQPVVSAGPPPSAFNAPPMAWPTLAGGPGGAPAAVSAQSSTLPSVGSSPLPTASRPVAAVAEMGGGGKGKKGKKGKGGKGQKVDLSLLGFSTGTDYSALEKPER